MTPDRFARYLLHLSLCSMMGLSTLYAQQSPAPENNPDKDVQLESMKLLMNETLESEGDAMSLIYYWNSLQEKKLDSMKIVISSLREKIEAVPPPLPEDTTIVNQVYQMLDDRRKEELALKAPAK
ncbi:MAG: hypothetical protein ABJF11_03285 [Reichenbachiella sp.]|uniref:hypothetical protein n=1 Tax=Reichenbachiella sp. TaxID=2184521 RepID=UPI003267795E